MHKSQRACMLFRADSGILCAMQQREVAVYGDNPKDKNSYTFIDDASAQKWVRETYPAMDIKKQQLDYGVEPVIEERDAEAHGLYVPDDSLELPGFGPHARPVGKKFQ
jgi:hypothetical protein